VLLKMSEKCNEQVLLKRTSSEAMKVTTFKCMEEANAIGCNM
jgi:hypothetical protein